MALLSRNRSSSRTERCGRQPPRAGNLPLDEQGGPIKQTGYGMAVSTSLSPEEAEAQIRASLQEEGFGVLTEIDLAATLKEKVGVERAPYKILGACNPTLAARAIEAEEDIGLLLPCNVVVYESGNRTVVAAMEPQTLVKLTSNPKLDEIALEARQRLDRALSALPQ